MNTYQPESIDSSFNKAVIARSREAVDGRLELRNPMVRHQRHERLKWCEAIASVSRSEDLAAVLGEECGLLTGGCLIFALALKPFFHDSVLYGFWRDRGQQLEHVVLMLPEGSTVDGHGWLDAGQLWQIWLRLYRPSELNTVELKPVTLEDCLAMQCGEYEALGGKDCVETIEALLHAALIEVQR